MGSLDDVHLQTLKRLVPALLLLPGFIVSLDHQSLALPERAIVAPVQDLDVDCELDQASCDLHLVLLLSAAGEGDGYIGLVPGNGPAYDRIGLLFRGLTESQSALDRFTHGVVYLLQQRRFSGEVVKRKYRDGMNAGRQSTAGKAVASADDERAKAQEETRYPA